MGGRFRPIAARGYETAVRRADGHRWMLNPGSVGMPRDRGPKGCYMLLDLATDTARFRRVEATP